MKNLISRTLNSILPCCQSFKRNLALKKLRGNNMVTEFNEKRISLFHFSFSCCQEFSHLSPIIVSQFQNNNVFFNNRLVIRCTYGNCTISTNHLSFRVFIFYIFKIHFSTKTTIRSNNRRKTQATTLKLWTFRDV